MKHALSSNGTGSTDAGARVVGAIGIGFSQSPSSFSTWIGGMETTLISLPTLFLIQDSSRHHIRLVSFYSSGTSSLSTYLHPIHLLIFVGEHDPSAATSHIFSEHYVP